MKNSQEVAMTSFDGYDDPEEFADQPGRHARRDIETDLRDLLELIANAKQMPLSNSALIPREDVLGLLEQALRSLPEEIREARWALRDREELMAAELQKAQQLMDQVRAEAARMVDKTEIVRQSRLVSQQIIAEAHTQARQMINQSEDFIDGKLASFEIVLERLLKTARSGRERLSAQGLPTSLIDQEATATEESFLDQTPNGYVAPSTHEETSFFDQDAF
jgi:cell division septum initiation protein DivIVA